MRLGRGIFYCLVLLIVLLLLNIGKLATPLPQLVYSQDNNQTLLTPVSEQRALNQTILTFPEWFLVYSPDEFADMIKTQYPSQFPFFKHIWQYWNSYDQVTGYAAELNQPNPGYIVMLVVIGSSTTVEYFLRGIYESTIGNFTAHVSGRSAEDDYAYQQAKAYSTFIKIYPWYQFDFYGSLKGLWLNVPWYGPHMLRKWERRYILTTEYLIKWGYAELIEVLTHAAYGVASEHTVLLVNHLPKSWPANMKDLLVLNKNVNGMVLIQVPRYAAFADYAEALAKGGSQFVEIAGNRSFIAISILVPERWLNPCVSCQVLFTQPIYTVPGTERLFMIVPVKQLAGALNTLIKQGANIEHIYDY